jgi:hypothetical protein
MDLKIVNDNLTTEFGFLTKRLEHVCSVNMDRGVGFGLAPVAEAKPVDFDPERMMHVYLVTEEFSSPQEASNSLMSQIKNIIPKSKTKLFIRRSPEVYQEGGLYHGFCRFSYLKE